jgi:O-6-methylguanine DNA methyltransferase
MKTLSITYTITDCALGRLLVAATEQGLCAVSLGDTDEALETALEKTYSTAILQREDDSLHSYVTPLLRYLSGKQREFVLPVDIQGTSFQQQVWKALRAIPYGETRSYGTVARMLNQPTATRAVANACASNPLALVIPCHRVIRSDGKLGGYSCGVERKQMLLAIEAGEAGSSLEATNLS